MISVDELTRRGAALGAFAYLEKPVSRESLQAAFQHISTFLDRSVRQLLLVEDDDHQRDSIIELVGEGDDVKVSAVRSAEEALAALDSGQFDCMVVDLVLPGDDGVRLVERVKTQARYRDLPIVVYTGKELTEDEEARLKKYTQSIILKSGVQLAGAAAQGHRALPASHRGAAARAVEGDDHRDPQGRSDRRWAKGPGHRR